MDSGDGVVTRAASVPAPAGTRARFVIDARRSRFTVQAFAGGILSAMGHNPTVGIRTFSGELEFDPVALEAGVLRLTIQSGSLEILDDISDKDRREMERVMKNDVLEVARYPQITFEAAAISVTRLDGALYSATLSGNLSFHGVSRNQPVTCRIVDSGEMLRASGDFILRQSDYQIKPVSVAGGALKLKDELKFAFEIIARRQEPSA
jgi:polyisoprenoid-binding protein YceI